MAAASHRRLVTMTPKNPSENEKQLSGLLAQWKVGVSLPPRFPEQVWKRIAQAETQRPQSSLTVFERWVENAFRRPTLAFSYVAVLLVSAAGMGYWQAQAKTAQDESGLRARYVQSVDPYQMPR
jgi:hypothetical protein